MLCVSILTIHIPLLANQLLVPTNIGRFSYISCDGNKLFYTSDTQTVSCCDMNGKSIWSFKDSSLLRSPRGVVVSSHGFVHIPLLVSCLYRNWLYRRMIIYRHLTPERCECNYHRCHSISHCVVSFIICTVFREKYLLVI
jgi:hypothetical protein